MDNELVQEYYKIVKEKLSQKRFDSALESAKKLTAYYPQNEYGYYYQAICYFTNGNYNEASFNYEKAVEINPLLAKARFNLGLCHYKQGNIDKALISLGAALVLFANSNEEHYKRRALDAINSIEEERKKDE